MQSVTEVLAGELLLVLTIILSSFLFASSLHISISSATPNGDEKKPFLEGFGVGVMSIAVPFPVPFDHPFAVGTIPVGYYCSVVVVVVAGPGTKRAFSVTCRAYLNQGFI
jgi:hypothetical protein